MTAEIVRATTSFRSGLVFIRAGDLFAADDPVVKGRERLFEPVVGAVRTTATTPAPPSSPPAFVPQRPAKTANKATWAAYVASFTPDGPTAEEHEAANSKEALEALAGRLEADRDG